MRGAGQLTPNRAYGFGVNSRLAGSGRGPKEVVFGYTGAGLRPAHPFRPRAAAPARPARAVVPGGSAHGGPPRPAAATPPRGFPGVGTPRRTRNPAAHADGHGGGKINS